MPTHAHELTNSNSLLELIPRAASKRMQAKLTSVTLQFGDVLYEPEDAIKHVYFPVDCLVSLLTAIDHGRTLEVGMVGNEGMVGMPMVLGIGISGVRALVQGRGQALRMTSRDFQLEFNRNPPLQKGLFRYTHLLMAQIAQTAACNRFHAVDARLGRWLLMTSDRLGAAQFRLTHEFLAHMLGVRRGGVTQAATNLERKHLIEYRRGNIGILNRKGLEAASCSCYAIIRNLQTNAHG